MTLLVSHGLRYVVRGYDRKRDRLRVTDPHTDRAVTVENARETLRIAGYRLVKVKTGDPV